MAWMGVLASVKCCYPVVSGLVRKDNRALSATVPQRSWELLFMDYWAWSDATGAADRGCEHMIIAVHATACTALTWTRYNAKVRCRFMFGSLRRQEQLHISAAKCMLTTPSFLLNERYPSKSRSLLVAASPSSHRCSCHSVDLDMSLNPLHRPTRTALFSR